ncbi:penicillin-binding transpeptidase domain-containing protein [Paenibacillus sp. IITD108]|uniref:penicillin-binding transpeptidase domain-containing protein n=1 Tax=Paenibacillus sp. IITD108 TaxID=3116649 RepID=UPI002F3F1DCB
MLKKIKVRTLLFGGIMTLLFLVLIGRIFYVQVVVGAQWYDIAKSRWSGSDIFKAKRGEITDRDGNMLAMDTIAYNVLLNPKAINEAGIANEVAEKLHELLDRPKEELMEQITAKKDDGTYFVQRELRKGGWQIDKAVADEIKAFSNELKERFKKEKKLLSSGIELQETLKRYYPRHYLASHLVGYITLDRETKTGIESYFDKQLTGEDGYIKYLKDGQRVQLAQGDVEYKEAKNGNRIKLTIDNDIQHYAEEALRKIGEEYSPKSATAIAVDPNTMEILAMANIPEYDPNEYWKGDYASYYNHAVRSLYEPGSTFKIMTLAAAVEEGVFDPEEMYKSGQIKVPGRVIREHNKVGWGTISFLDGLKYSSNVAFVKLGFERLGKEVLRDYYSRFGFGQKTGVELGGELAGTIDFHWPGDVASATFGQGVVQVTPLQQVAAVAAVANGGKLYKPQIIKEVTDVATNTTTVREPEFIRQVISEETSRQVGEYLEQVVSDQDKGTGKNAYIEGYRVAGKTGTAQKSINGKYSANKYVVSFIGYAPVEDPKIVVYVVVDEPNNPMVGGGKVAAPAFKEIVLKSLRKMGVQQQWTTNEQTEGDKKEARVIVPDVTKMKVGFAKEELKSQAMSFEIVGNGSTVIKQIPAAKSSVHPTQKIYLITEQEQNLAVPDLTGVSLRDALEITSIIGVKLSAEGQGYVVSQKLTEQGGMRQLKVILAPPVGSEAYESYVPPEEDAEADEEETDQSDEENADGQSGQADSSAANNNG